MAQLRITNGFDRLSDGDLLIRLRTIVSSMTGNTTFSTPKPTLTLMTELGNNFEQALIVAENGNSYEKAVKNEKRAELIDGLHSLSNYVLYTVNGDRAQALSSGFTVAKERQPAPPMAKPQGLDVTGGINPGELDVTFKRVQGARSYMIEYIQEPAAPTAVWHNQTCTVRKCTLTGLESSKKYQVRVAAVGIHDQLLYSDPVSRVVQ